MKRLPSVPKRIGKSVWKVTRTIGEVLWLIIQLIAAPFTWLSRFLD